MTSFVSRVRDLTNAPSAQALWGTHIDSMASYGFHRLIYCYVPDSGYTSHDDLGDPKDWVILSNLTSSYIEEFMASGSYHEGPMVRWTLSNTGAMSWREMATLLQSQPMTPELRQVLAINQKYNVMAGYTASFLALSSRTKGSIALMGNETATQAELDQIWNAHGTEILELNNIMHLKLLSLPHESARRLTDRQREVLRWISDGKTIQDAAVLMEISQATIEKHLRLARHALGVETTAQAVLKASFQNQIYTKAS